MPRTVTEDFRTMDPVAYIRSIGLQPEDSYGFTPMKVDEGATALFLYRDRPEYEAARPRLAAPEEATHLGPIRIEPTQQVEMEVEGDDLGGALDQIVAQAEQMQQQQWGAVAGGLPPSGAPGDVVSGPDPARLERLAKLRESGAISDEEYAKLASEESTPTAAPAGEPTGAPSGGAPIVAHRIYPGMRMRSSTRQLNHFLPKYLEIVGLRPEDTYGVFPWRRRWSGGAESSGEWEWNDYWIAYRDRPEYEAARDAYAAQADKKGRWPDAVISPGVGDAPSAGGAGGKLKVEKENWPRRALVMKESGPELAESIKEKISKFGYEPEDSFGFCPNFEHNRIYFGWRKR